MVNLFVGLLRGRRYFDVVRSRQMKFDARVHPRVGRQAEVVLARHVRRCEPAAAEIVRLAAELSGAQLRSDERYQDLRMETDFVDVSLLRVPT